MQGVTREGGQEEKKSSGGGYGGKLGRTTQDSRGEGGEGGAGGSLPGRAESLIAAVRGSEQAAPVANAPQAAAPANAQKTAETAPIVDPVSGTVKGQLARFSKNMVAAAEAMPAEKYNFKPTPEMNSFGHLIMHIAQSNHLFFSKISAAAPPDVKISASAPQ